MAAVGEGLRLVVSPQNRSWPALKQSKTKEGFSQPRRRQRRAAPAATSARERDLVREKERAQQSRAKGHGTAGGGRKAAGPRGKGRS